MRLTIIPSDNTVYVDGRALVVDCSSIDPAIHALQWDGEAGWIEYVQPPSGGAILNEPIMSLAPEYLALVAAWEAARESADAPAGED
jgi:hypothetical protein